MVSSECLGFGEGDVFKRSSQYYLHVIFTEFHAFYALIQGFLFCKNVILLHLDLIFKTMEKKTYIKPEIKNTKIDYSITLTQSSQDQVGPGTPTGGGPAAFPEFLNPMKWFK